MPLVAALLLLIAVAAPAADTGEVLKGTAAMQGWRSAAPGVRRLIRPEDLPAPYATRSASNMPQEVRRAGGALKLPPGFAVTAFASGLDEPRQLRIAPNGDVFLAESGADKVRVLRAGDGQESAEANHVFAKGLTQPFGIAFYPPGPDPQWVYVADTDKVLRFPYRSGDVEARGKPETVATLPGGGHWTRDVLFSGDGRKMYVAVGSASNVAEGGMGAERRRADILELNPDGSGERVFAAGLRNPVALALHPATGDLWTVVNERDGLGDDLPPDYVTRVRDGGFYGWPWYYIGAHQDPRHRGEHPELGGKVVVPDVLLEAHAAPLGLAVYTGTQFPAEYRGDIFVASHGSWNRATRTGYKLVRVRLEKGLPTGEYQDFMTGFVVSDGAVWGRPVGVATARDGALLMSDDASGTVWRIAYAGTPAGR